MGIVSLGLRSFITDPQRAEIGVLQHAAVGVQGLAKDFFTVGGEQDATGPPYSCLLLAEGLIIESGNHGLSRTSGRHNQVTEVATLLTLYFQFI